MTLKLVADAADITAGVLVIGTLTKWLPPIAAAFAILWTVIRIFEWARVALWGKPKRQPSSLTQRRSRYETVTGNNACGLRLARRFA